MKYAICKYLTDVPNGTPIVTSQSSYYFIIPTGMNVKKDDLALVLDKYSEQYKIVLVTDVTDIPNPNYNGKYKQLISKVDITNYCKHIKAESEQIKIEKQIEEKIKDCSKLVLFEYYADKDPELKRMIDEYKRLSKEINNEL